jgi:hypothetical protein
VCPSQFILERDAPDNASLATDPRFVMVVVPDELKDWEVKIIWYSGEETSLGGNKRSYLPAYCEDTRSPSADYFLGPASPS